jgi:hypothetical protein
MPLCVPKIHWAGSKCLCRYVIRADFDLDPEADAVIWVKQVDQPEAFGVVKPNERE